MSLKIKAILIGLVYLAGCASGVILLKRFSKPPPPASVAESSDKSEKENKVIQHFSGTIKKKDGDVIEWKKDVESSSRESEDKKKLLSISDTERQDNLKVNFDSTLKAGVEIKPYELVPLQFVPKKLWVGYSRDFRNSENIVEISYSTRLELWH